MIYLFLVLDIVMFGFIGYACYKLGWYSYGARVMGTVGNVLRRQDYKQATEPPVGNEADKLKWIMEQMKVYQEIVGILLDDAKMEKAYKEYTKFREENPLYGIKRNYGVNGEPREANRAEPDSAVNSTH